VTAAAERSQPAHIGTHEHFRWLEGIVKVTLVLNLLDAVFTLLWVRAGLAEEANPFLRDLVHGFPVIFVVAKLGLVGLASLLLWRLRRRPLAVVGLFLAFFVYYALLLIHIDYLSTVLGMLFFG